MTGGSDSKPKPGGCPDAGLIAAHAERRLVGEEAAWMDEHLASCPTCHEVFAETIRFALEEEETGLAPWPAWARSAGRRALARRPAFRLAASIAAVAAALILALQLWRAQSRAPREETRVAEAPEAGMRGHPEPKETGKSGAESAVNTKPRPESATPATRMDKAEREVSPPAIPRPDAAGASAPTRADEPPAPLREDEAVSKGGSEPAESSVAPPAPASVGGVAAAGAEQEPDEGMVRLREEYTVVSASRVETRIVDAPATMSVISSEMLEMSPAQNVADTLRWVPGLNVIQNNARDFNLTARQATSSVAPSTLVTVDGRSVYLDFFDFVLWDFVPSPFSGEIEQIEVVRGPASVVWGANAVNGVVNFITKRPRVNEGFSLVLGAGLFDRAGGSREGKGSGHVFDGGVSLADALNETWSYKLSAGYYHSDAYSRPVGQIPLDCHPLGTNPCRDASGTAVPGGYPIGGATYPADADVPGGFENDGTSQPKLYLRVDQDLRDGGRITYEGGFGGTQGIIHTGIGPFDLQSGSHMGFGRVAYNKGALRVGAFANLLDAEAPNLLQPDPDTLSPIILGFKTRTYDLEFGNTSVLGGRHALSYGGNYRRNNFDITLAQGPDRNEFGAYGHWEYFVDSFRLAAGVRADKFGSLKDWVWSPRVSVMFKPNPDQSIRASYNRAFVSPSFINSHLDQELLSPTPVDLTPLAAVLPPPLQALVPPPFLLTVKSVGNPELREQSTEAYEIAYTGTFGRTTVGLAGYVSDTNNNIGFVSLLPPGTSGYPLPTYYDVRNPARGVTVPTPTEPAVPITLSPVLMGVLEHVPPELGGPIRLPDMAATYLNLGPVRNRGIEASVDHLFNNEVWLFANYSWQDTPRVLDSDQTRYPANALGIPPKHRFNIGLGYKGPRIFANANVNHAGKALWVDVLSSEYAGFTRGYTMLNATLGVKLAEGKVMLSLKGTNLTNQRIQQHIFGDLIRRSIVGELRLLVR